MDQSVALYRSSLMVLVMPWHPGHRGSGGGLIRVDPGDMQRMAMTSGEAEAFNQALEDLARRFGVSLLVLDDPDLSKRRQVILDAVKKGQVPNRYRQNCYFSMVVCKYF